MIQYWFFFLIIMIIIYIWVAPIIKIYQRQKISKKAFPSQWIYLLENQVSYYQKLNPNLRKELQKKILVFLAEKQFIGCQGLIITEEIKIIISAYACLLLLNQRSNYYPYLDSIFVYPYIFKVKREQILEELTLEEEQILSGESWGKKGLIVLAWEQIKQDINNNNSVHNVILHEFAHQLDQEDGSMNGVPKLKNNQEYERWQRVFQNSYQELNNKLRQGQNTIINAYGATNTAEFFAVVTETYFTQPLALKKQYFALYTQLKDYYEKN